MHQATKARRWETGAMASKNDARLLLVDGRGHDVRPVRRVGHQDQVPQTLRWRKGRTCARGCRHQGCCSLQDRVHIHQGAPEALHDRLGIEQPRIGFADQVYATESGRLDVYYENMLKWDQALPTWEETIEVYDDNPAREQFPYQLTQTRSRFLIHSMFYDAKWINQFYDAYVEMNPADMAAAGVKDREMVEVYNDRGSFKCAVIANESVHPGSLRTTEGAWSRNMEDGHLQSVTNDQMRERRVDLMKGGVTPFNDTLVAIRKA